MIFTDKLRHPAGRMPFGSGPGSEGLARWDDRAEGHDRLRLALIAALARELPRNGTLLAIGLPGSPTACAFQAARPDLGLVEALSDAVFEAYPGYAATLGCGPAAAVVLAQQDRDLLVAEQRAFAGHQVTGTGQRLRCTTPAAVLGHLRRPALAVFGPEAGHAGLLQAALPVLADGPVMVWCDLAPGTGRARAADLLAALAGDLAGAFGLWALVPGQGLLAAAKLGAAEPRALLLVPCAGWDVAGLDAVAGSDRPGLRLLAEPLPPLVVARGAGPARALAERIAPGLETLPLPVPEKTLRLAGSHLFAEGARLVPQGAPPLLQTRGQPLARFLALAPAPGRYLIGLALASAPDAAALAGLQMQAGPDRIPMAWAPDSASDGASDGGQFRALGAVTVSDPFHPFVITARQPGRGIALRVTAMEFHLLEAFGAGPGVAGL